MENYIKQKRATPGMVQASDLQMRPMSGTAQISTSGKANSAIRISSSREMHGYDGPMQYMMSANNPDQILPTSALTSPSSEGNLLFYCRYLLLIIIMRLVLYFLSVSFVRCIHVRCTHLAYTLPNTSTH